jgi:hypothetical protein
MSMITAAVLFRRPPPLVAFLSVYWLLLLCSFAPYDGQQLVYALALCALATVGTMAGWKSVFWCGVVFTIWTLNGAVQTLLSPSIHGGRSVLVLARLFLAAVGLIGVQMTTVLEWFGFQIPRYSRQTFWLVCTGFALAFLPGILMQLWVGYFVRCGLHIG